MQTFVHIDGFCYHMYTLANSICGGKYAHKNTCYIHYTYSPDRL